MMTHNTIAPISEMLKACLQQLIEKALAFKEFSSGDADVIEGDVKLFHGVIPLVEELQIAEERIATNANLSAIGQREEMAKVVKAFHVQAKKDLERKATDRRNAYEAEQKAMFETPKGLGDPTVSFLKEQEQRRRLRTLPLSEQMRAYADAVQRNEPSLVRAVKDPAFAGQMLADPQFANFVQRVDREHVEHGQPERWARLETLKHSAQWLQFLWSTIDMTLSNYNRMPEFPTPPIRKTDLGLRNTQQPAPKKEAVDRMPDHVPAFQ